jgi:hypothetical protein
LLLCCSMMIDVVASRCTLLYSFQNIVAETLFA